MHQLSLARRSYWQDQLVVAILVAALTFHLPSAPSALSAQEVSGHVDIVDGDTIRVEGITIRLHGIDAPEAGQMCNKARRGVWRCGEAAMDRLENLTNENLTCRGTEFDAYDRLIAVCYGEGGTDINQVMVAEGYAWAFHKYSEDYARDENTARSRKLGVWQAETQTAWEYRAAKWDVAAQQAPSGCPIKGNISKNGNIYHPPWSPWYAKTKISTERGERWFCSEREAIDAGWRAPAWR